MEGRGGEGEKEEGRTNPVEADQIRTVESSDPVTIRIPSNATA